MPKPNIGQGDGGTTNLIGSDKKILKSSSHIESIGALDELVSLLSFAKIRCGDEKIFLLLEKIQDHLFRIESLISASPRLRRGEADHAASYWKYKARAAGLGGILPYIGKEHVKFLEDKIDYYEKDLPELQNFILPGGTELAALFHIARAESRRVERVLVRAGSEEIELHPQAIPYLNRLSDVFFALARWVNYTAGIKESIWIGLGKEHV